MNASANVAAPDRGFVTVTSTVPALPAGVTAVSVVLLETEMEGAGTPPKGTSAAAATPCPVTVTAVPPSLVPEVGLIDEIDGAPW